MIRFTEQRLQQIIQSAAGKKILILGDLMVDEYMWGRVSRISPEAPVPIINISEEQLRLGGAANVAANLLGLNTEPVLAGVIGDDPMGKNLRRLLQGQQLSLQGVLSDPQRPTTVKTRIIGNNQHVARVDRETTERISGEMQQQLFQFFIENIQDAGAVILQDYNKGVVAPELAERVIELANRCNVITTVDPKFENFHSFKNVTVFKPNIKETEEALAMRIRNEADLTSAGNILLEKLGCGAALITRGSLGMALFEKGAGSTFLATRARKVADVSGAGDTVIATLTFALCGGASIKEAVALANYAAGQVCQEVGVVAVDLPRLVKQIIKNQDSFED
ncbi:MAG: D-glycero-beta-D-manno-heptose-7-phosphate kinase [Calditrichia bacterium]